MLNDKDSIESQPSGQSGQDSSSSSFPYEDTSTRIMKGDIPPAVDNPREVPQDIPKQSNSSE